MNAIEMLMSCRAHQENVLASDATVEAIADTPHFAEEPLVTDAHPLSNAVDVIRREVEELGLTD